MAYRYRPRRTPSTIPYLIGSILATTLASATLFALNTKQTPPSDPIKTYTVSEAEQNPRDKLFEDTINAYLRSPAFAHAQKEHGVKTIQFAPPPEYLKLMLIKSYAPIISDKKELSDLIQQEMNSHAITGHDIAATIIPGLTTTYGHKLDRHVLFRRRTYFEPTIQNANDIRSTIEHELFHIADYTNGINECGHTITPEHLKQGTITHSFLISLLEVRAYDHQLRDILDRKGTPHASSAAFFQHIIITYEIKKNEFERSAVTTHEKKFLQTPRTEFTIQDNDIRFFYDGKTVTLR